MAHSVYLWPSLIGAEFAIARSRRSELFNILTLDNNVKYWLPLHGIVVTTTARCYQRVSSLNAVAAIVDLFSFRQMKKRRHLFVAVSFDDSVPSALAAAATAAAAAGVYLTQTSSPCFATAGAARRPTCYGSPLSDNGWILPGYSVRHHVTFTSCRRVVVLHCHQEHNATFLYTALIVNVRLIAANVVAAADISGVLRVRSTLGFRRQQLIGPSLSI